MANETLFISGTGEQTRSWCHIKDFVEGVVACVFFDSARNQTFNIGNDTTEISLIDLARMIVEISQSSSSIEVQGNSRHDVLNRRPNLKKAKKLLGYAPRIGLAEGIADMVRWARAGAG